MPQFTIVPNEKPEAAVQIDAIDGGAALHIASTMKCREADVWQDDAYLFSVRTLGGDAAFWEIFQRPGAAEGDFSTMG